MIAQLATLIPLAHTVGSPSHSRARDPACTEHSLTSPTPHRNPAVLGTAGDELTEPSRRTRAREPHRLLRSVVCLRLYGRPPSTTRRRWSE
jgi:hypothetical protein